MESFLYLRVAALISSLIPSKTAALPPKFSFANSNDNLAFWVFSFGVLFIIWIKGAPLETISPSSTKLASKIPLTAAYTWYKLSGCMVTDE